MKKTAKCLTWMLISGLLISCGDNTQEPQEVETAEIVFEKEGELYLLKAGDTIKQIDIEVASTSYEQETGLMYRDSMEDDQGMLFIYSSAAPRSFYMKNTRIPLDILFYGSDSTLVSYKENATPYDETSIPSNAPAQFILELNAGKIQEWGIETGDKMDFRLIN